MSKKVWLSSDAYEFVNKIAYEQNKTLEQVVEDLIMREAHLTPEDRLRRTIQHFKPVEKRK